MQPGPSEASVNTMPAVKLEVTYYTDPLCCWSWGFEPQLRRLRYAYAGRLAWRTRMGAMIIDWEHFGDPLNSVHRPAQMGPLWLQAASVTGIPLEADIWVNDPPESSFPACLAVKAAEIQSAAAGDLLLRRLREAVMLAGRNIARPEVILDVARDLANARPETFDFARFERDVGTTELEGLLGEDVREARFRGIGRFPCLVLHRPPTPPVYLVGWRPYQSLRESLLSLAPDLGGERRPAAEAVYSLYWGGTTREELREAFDATAPADLDPRFLSPSSGSGE